MKVSVVYAGEQQVLLNCQYENELTVGEAIAQSGILDLCPEINLEAQKVGIFGRFVTLDSPLKEGERIEIYRKITRVLDEDDDDDDEL